MMMVFGWSEGLVYFFDGLREISLNDAGFWRIEKKWGEKFFLIFFEDLGKATRKAMRERPGIPGNLNRTPHKPYSLPGTENRINIS
jgi:hypothetical protein